jgi:hypothetical protein
MFGRSFLALFVAMYGDFGFGLERMSPERASESRTFLGSLSRTRTCDRSINSRLLYQLSYQGSGDRLL